MNWLQTYRVFFNDPNRDATGASELEAESPQAAIKAVRDQLKREITVTDIVEFKRGYWEQVSLEGLDFTMINKEN